MNFFLLFFTVIFIFFAQEAHAQIIDKKIMEAARVAGCALDKGHPDTADLQKLPGQADPALFAVTSLYGEPDSDSLGELCVGLVREKDGHFTSVAKLEDSSIEPESEVDPVTNTYAKVDEVPYRFMPKEEAFAVTVQGEYNSTSTNAVWGTLYLFRRVNDKIILIFSSKVLDETMDKTGSGDDNANDRWIVRFDSKMNNGAYDLILQKYHASDKKIFKWNGSVYDQSSE